jgi:hypothetical protein
MVLRFGILIESLNSCILLSQHLCCLIKSSSVFSLTSIYFIFEFWDSVFHLFLSAEMASHCAFVWLKRLFISRICVWFFFSEVFLIFVQLLFHILCCLLYIIYLCFYSLLCFSLVFLEVSEFIWLFLCLLMLSVVSWSFLSASCTFWLTMSYSFSMSFSVMSFIISLWEFFLWASLSSFIIVLLGSELGIHFLHFPLNPLLNFFVFEECRFLSSSFSHHSNWCCTAMFLIGYLAVLIACFLSLDLTFVLWLTWLLARLMCSFCPLPGDVN